MAVISLAHCDPLSEGLPLPGPLQGYVCWFGVLDDKCSLNRKLTVPGSWGPQTPEPNRSCPPTGEVDPDLRITGGNRVKHSRVFSRAPCNTSISSGKCERKTKESSDPSGMKVVLAEDHGHNVYVLEGRKCPHQVRAWGRLPRQARCPLYITSFQRVTIVCV